MRPAAVWGIALVLLLVGAGGGVAVAKVVDDSSSSSSTSTTSTLPTSSSTPTESSGPTTTGPAAVVAPITGYTTVPPDVLDPRAPMPSVDLRTYVYLCQTPPTNVVVQKKGK